MRLRLVGVGVAAAVLALAACSSSGSGGTPVATSPSTGSSAVTGGITVFAAASLTEAFTTIGAGFEAENPGTTVTFNFGASSTLATQITEKAPADVFASASTRTMDTVVSAGEASSPTVFAVNTLAIATPLDPPYTVSSLADLGKPDAKIAVCQQDVPCGAAARSLFEKNQLTVTPASEEVDVKAVISKVQLGEVDAGIVYVTDIRASNDKVIGITIPAGDNVTTDYPIASITGSPNPATAAAFVAYVLSPAGQQVLTDAGFTSP